MNFSRILTIWYSNNKRDFPWRNTKDPYCIWVSEVILQQTQAKQGLPYYEAFMARFPTVFHLAKADESEVLKLWQGLGYYSRARNLHQTAQYIVKTYGGYFPGSYSELIELKGIGDYTASAIASICFGKATAVVDGNVYRVLSRYFGIDTPTNTSKGIREFKALATTLIDKNNPGDHNQAIMEFGATQCKPSAPNCTDCPLNTACVAYAERKISAFPVKCSKPKITKRHFNFLVFLSNDRKTLFEKRNSKGIWQNLYQFPLVETKAALDPEKFSGNNAIKTLLKNTPYRFSLYNERETVHKLSHQHLYTRFWIVQVEKLPQNGIPISEVTKYPAPILIANFIDAFGFSI